MTSLAAMFPENDPSRHTSPMTDAQIIHDQQQEIASLKEQLRLERTAHERTKAQLVNSMANSVPIVRGGSLNVDRFYED